MLLFSAGHDSTGSVDTSFRSGVGACDNRPDCRFPGRFMQHHHRLGAPRGAQPGRRRCATARAPSTGRFQAVSSRFTTTCSPCSPTASPISAVRNRVVQANWDCGKAEPRLRPTATGRRPPRPCPPWSPDLEPRCGRDAHFYARGHLWNGQRRDAAQPA